MIKFGTKKTKSKFVVLANLVLHENPIQVLQNALAYFIKILNHRIYNLKLFELTRLNKNYFIAVIYKDSYVKHQEVLNNFKLLFKTDSYISILIITKKYSFSFYKKPITSRLLSTNLNRLKLFSLENKIHILNLILNFEQNPKPKKYLSDKYGVLIFIHNQKMADEFLKVVSENAKLRKNYVYPIDFIIIIPDKSSIKLDGIENNVITNQELPNLLDNMNSKYCLVIQGLIKLKEHFFEKLDFHLENNNYPSVLSTNYLKVKNDQEQYIVEPNFNIDEKINKSIISDLLILKTSLLKEGLKKHQGESVNEKLRNLLENNDINDFSQVPDFLFTIHQSELTEKNQTKIESELDKEEVTIIIPFKDQVQLLKSCILSIQSKTIYKNYKILLINNSSIRDETNNYLKKITQISNIEVFDYYFEFNYSKINNFAVKRVKSKYILFLNNDTEVITEGWLKNMLLQLHKHNVGAVGCTLLYDDYKIQHQGVYLSYTDLKQKRPIADHINKGILFNNKDKVLCNFNLSNPIALTGACLLTKREDFTNLGMFNEEKLGIAFNDVDYCLKLKSAGKRCVLLHNTLLFHKESYSGKQSKNHRHESREFNFLYKNWKKDFKGIDFLLKCH